MSISRNARDISSANLSRRRLRTVSWCLTRRFGHVRQGQRANAPKLIGVLGRVLHRRALLAAGSTDESCMRRTRSIDDETSDPNHPDAAIFTVYRVSSWCAGACGALRASVSAGRRWGTLPLTRSPRPTRSPQVLVAEPDRLCGRARRALRLQAVQRRVCSRRASRSPAAPMASSGPQRVSAVVRLSGAQRESSRSGEVDEATAAALGLTGSESMPATLPCVGGG